MKPIFALAAAYFMFITSAAEANDPRALQLTYQPWTKSCFDRSSDCFFSAGMIGQCFPSEVVLLITAMNGKAIFNVKFHTKRTFDGPISVQIDRHAPFVIPDPLRHWLSYEGKFKTDNRLIERMREGQTMTIEAADTAHEKISIPFPLADFAKVYDQPAAKPKMFEMSQEQLKERLRQRAEQQPPQCEE